MAFGDLQISWLETFVVLADYKKQTAAAEVRGVHQSTIHRHIESLEQWLDGVVLFTGDVPAVLSPAGEDFLKVAREVVKVLREGRASVVLPVAPPQPRISGRDVQLPD